MSNGAWTSYRLSGPSEHTELYAQALLDAGCDGVQIADSRIRFDETEDASIEACLTAEVTGYVHEASGELTARLRQQIGQLPGPPELESSTFAASDWENEWKQGFPPLRIGPFLIVGSWEDNGNETPTAPLPIVLRLDPGLALGTGQHPTTRLCLELLSELLAGSAGGCPHVLDVGCGSGILSIAAAKLGANVLAADLDPWCVAATRDNAAANDVTLRVVRAAGLGWLRQPVGIVLANLASATLISLSTELARSVAPGGTLIASGISLVRADEVQATLISAGLRLVERREGDGEIRDGVPERWVALRLQTTVRP